MVIDFRSSPKCTTQQNAKIAFYDVCAWNVCVCVCVYAIMWDIPAGVVDTSDVGPSLPPHSKAPRQQCTPGTSLAAQVLPPLPQTLAFYPQDSTCLPFMWADST